MRSSQAADQETLLKAVLQASADEIVVFDADTLRILQANRAAAKNLQRPPKALRRLTPLDWLSTQHVQAFTAALTVLRGSKKRQVAFATCCRRENGSVYPVEAKLIRSISRGNPVFIWIASDVSQREASQQALAHSASDLRAIVGHIPGMAYQILRKHDGSTVMRYVSEQSAQLLGIKAAVLRAHPERFFELIMEQDKTDYLGRLDAAGGIHMSFNWEGRIWMEAWKDVKWVNLRVSQRETPDGLIWDGIMLNVTKSKLAEAEILRSRAQLSALAAHVELVREQERLHLAREVHDDLGGNLTAIKIGLSWLMRRQPTEDVDLFKRTAYLDKVADQTIEATHRIASSLRPPVLDFGIVAAIEWQLERFGRNADLAYEFTASDNDIALNPDIAICVFRIAQEALTNVAKHAGATRVEVALTREQDSLLLTVTDDGQGIAPAQGSNGHRFGLLGMSERAAALGGVLSVLPAKRRGTQVCLRVPLPSRTSDTPE